MSRPLRIEYEYAWYHVMNRGANKQAIFHCQDHYKMFITLLNEIHNRYRVEVHAYCLMNNHYHLLICTRLANLSRVMRHLDGVYTQRYNKSQQTDGPLFRGRFKAIIVDSEKYLLQLSRYIHLNPVVGKLVTNPEDYMWSSYLHYMKPSSKPYWLTVDKILSRFDRVADYYTFVNEGVDQELLDFFKRKMKKLHILGSETFIDRLRKKYLQSKNLEPEIPEQNWMSDLVAIDHIVEIVADYYQVEAELIKTVKRKCGNQPRQVAIYLVCKLSGQKHNVIANYFTNICYSGIAKSYLRTKERINDDVSFRRVVSHIEKSVMSYVKT